MKKVIRVSESNLVKLIQKVLVEEKHINPKKLNEQADLGYDIATIMGELNKNNSDEQKIVDIVKKYTDKASFKQFVDQYKAKSGKDFGEDIFGAIQPNNDKTEWADLSNHLKSMGITLSHANTGGTPQRPKYSATFTGLDTPAAPMTADQEKLRTTLTSNREKQLLAMYKSVKNGIIVNPSSVENGTKWTDFLTAYKVTQDELNKVIKSGMTNVVNNPKVNTNVVNNPKVNTKPKVVRNYTTMLAEI